MKLKKTMKLNTKSIVIIDASVENYQQLFNGVVPGVKPFLLGGDTDGIQQIGDILQKHPETDTLHIISHGSPGCLYLGNSQLSLDTLKQYAPEVQLWDIDNLVLYGCYVAAGDAGEEFVGKLSGLMGANIAASKTLIGSAAKGGNWELEVNTGQQRPTLALQTEVVETYSGVLVDNEIIISTNAMFAHSVYAKDVDGDGDMDVLSASSKDNKIALYLNDGSNNFTEQTISNNAIVAFSVFAADMDSDGDVDVLSASWLDDKIALYETVPLPNVSINAAGTPQERGETTGTFTIDRGTDTAGDITVYFTVSGNATEGTDYTTGSTTFTGGKGSVVIPAGQTSVDIEITAKSDNKVDEPNEEVTLTLTKDPKYDVSSTPGDETATLTIKNYSEADSWGDVHFVTFDGRKYDLQSFGDFILAQTARKDDDWIVQTRQDPWRYNGSVSVNTAFATLVDGQKVVFNTKFPNNRLQIDGVDFPLANGETKSIGNSKIERYNNKYTIKYAGNDGIIDIDDPQLIAFDYNRFLNIHIPNFDTMQGLLGNNDGDPTNDFALRNGTQLPNNLTAQEIHNTYGESWRVQPEESLFENSAPNIDIPKKIISLEDFPQDQVQEAKNKVFEAGIIDPDRIDAVALDILGTGDEIFLTSAVEFFGFIDGTINSPPTDLNLDNTTTNVRWRIVNVNFRSHRHMAKNI